MNMNNVTYIPISKSPERMGAAIATVWRYVLYGLLLENGERIYLASEKINNRRVVPISGDFGDSHYGIEEFLGKQIGVSKLGRVAKSEQSDSQ
jgi:hypothetical protein